MTTNPRRRIRSRAIVATIAAALTVVLATGSPAGASIGVSGGSPWTDGQPVTITGSRPTTGPMAGATHRTIAQCNVLGRTTQASWGEQCSQVGVVGFTAVGTATFTVSNYALDRDWTTSVDFTTGGTTSFDPADCSATGGDQCAVVISYYSIPNYPAGPYTHLGAEKFDITY